MPRNYSLKDILLMGLTLVIIATAITFYVHFSLEQRQTQREIIYLRARQLAAEQQQERVRAYQKRLQEKRLTQEYSRGRVVNIAP